jgi:hypothetical protein
MEHIVNSAVLSGCLGILANIANDVSLKIESVSDEVNDGLLINNTIPSNVVAMFTLALVFSREYYTNIQKVSKDAEDLEEAKNNLALIESDLEVITSYSMMSLKKEFNGISSGNLDTMGHAGVS